MREQGPVAYSSDAPSTIQAPLHSDRWSFRQGQYPPDLAMPPHTHKRAGLYLGMQGTHTVISRKTAHLVEPGTLVFHPAEEPHQCRFPAKTKTFEMYLEPAWIEQLYPRLTMLDRPGYHRGGRLATLARRAFEQFCIRDTFSSLALEGLVLEMLAELARRTVSEGASWEARPPRWLREVESLLHERFADSLTLDEIARVAGVHPAHLGRMFRRYYRCTVGEYLRDLRLKYACGRLATEMTPLVEIALSCGYADQSSFTTAFKRHTGLTPKEYRRVFYRR